MTMRELINTGTTFMATEVVDERLHKLSNRLVIYDRKRDSTNNGAMKSSATMTTITRCGLAHGFV